MLYEAFGLSYASMIATFIWSVVICLIGYFGVFKLRLFDVLVKQPLATPFMGIPALMFGFLMVFMASAAWQNISLARTALVNEHAAVARMAAVPIEPADQRQKLRVGMRRYLAAVLDDEWSGRHNEERSAGAETALAEIETDIWTIDTLCRGQTQPCSNGQATSTFLKALDDLRLAREERLSLAFQGGLRLKWALAISLAIVTSLSIAAVHRATPRTAMIGLGLFGCAIWMSFSVVTLNIQPYRGPDALSPAMLKAMHAKL